MNGDDPTWRTRTRPRHAPIPGLARGRILVVDDEQGVMVTIQAILEQEGYTVDSASSGTQAIEKLHAQQYDLVLTDLRLGDIDGLEVLAEARRSSPRTVAIVLTGYASLESAIQAMREGAYDYLVKPTDVEELKMRVRHVFERLQLTDELARRVQQLEAAYTTIDDMNANLRDQIDEATAQLRERVAELNETKDALEAEKTKRERFIAMVAHDMRAPLGPIKLGAQIIARDRERGTAFAPFTQTIEEQVDRLERLINDLLLMTRIDTGEFQINPEACDLAALVRKQVEQYRLAQTERTFALTAPETLPGTFDEDRIVQALNNLLENAIKYSFPGTTITVTLEQVTPDRAALSVADEGKGIPPDKLAEIFDPFKRLEGTEDIKGFGLGLYITRGIAEAHGGTLAVASGTDRAHGAIFTLTLPVSATPRLQGRGLVRTGPDADQSPE
jgi:signal transduction histidine kinase